MIKFMMNSSGINKVIPGGLRIVLAFSFAQLCHSLEAVKRERRENRVQSMVKLSLKRRNKNGEADGAGMDMLNGSLLDKIILFALPLALGSILQQLFNAVDIAVVGRFASSEALAAVGANSSLVMLILGLFLGLSVGSNVVIARYLGEGREDRISNAVHTSMTLSLISGIILLFIGQLVARPMLALMATPENIMDLAVLYLRIYSLGMPFIMIYNFGAAILRSFGDTRRPLMCLIISGVLNAVLNVFFVVVLHMSVSGVAIATVTANGVSAAMVVYFLIKEKGPVRLEPGRLGIHREDLMRIVMIGLPAGLQSMVFSFSNVFIQSAINGFGSYAVAGNSVAVNFEFIAYFMINGFNQAAVTFTSQNYGAGKKDRCLRILFICLACAAVANVCLAAFFYLGKGFILPLFTTDQEVIDYAVIRMSCVLLFQWTAASYEVGGSALRGYGYSMVPAVLTVFGTCLLRIVWIHTVAVYFKTFASLLACYPFSWLVTGTLVLTAYGIIWRKRISPSSEV